jgi:lipid A oxidase
MIRSSLIPGFAPVLLCLLAASPALGENQISVYGGIQEASPGQVSGTAQGVPFDFSVDWQGDSFRMPPYYGLRATHWFDDSPFGLALEFTHTKAYADDATLESSGFSVLEFSDGLNSLTLNAMQRFAGYGRFTPYAGVGVGLSIPHVEVQASPSSPQTFEYQLAGPSVRALAGVEYEISESWSVFGEFNATWSDNQADLAGGGSLSAEIVTQAVNIGASFRF